MLLAFHEVPEIRPSDRAPPLAEHGTEQVLAALEAVAGESCDDRSLWEKLAKDLYKARSVRGKLTSEALNLGLNVVEMAGL